MATKTEGTTTTPFDMVVLNDLDRFHLAQKITGWRWAEETAVGARGSSTEADNV